MHRQSRAASERGLRYVAEPLEERRYLSLAFLPQQTIATGNRPTSVAVDYVELYGGLDVIVANSGSNTVGVLLGNGNGTFAPKQTFATGSNPVSVGVVSDLHGDGIAGQ